MGLRESDSFVGLRHALRCEGRRCDHRPVARASRSLFSPTKLLARLLTDTKKHKTPVFFTPVCTENLNPDVVVMKSAKDRV
jgi:hypothetical protein